jgi:hypothetical protein
MEQCQKQINLKKTPNDIFIGQYQKVLLKHIIWRCIAYSAAAVTFFFADFGAMIMSILFPSSLGRPST